MDRFQDNGANVFFRLKCNYMSESKSVSYFVSRAVGNSKNKQDVGFGKGRQNSGPFSSKMNRSQVMT